MGEGHRPIDDGPEPCILNPPAKFSPQSAPDPNAGEIIALDNVKPHNDQDDSPTAAAGDVYYVASTLR